MALCSLSPNFGCGASEGLRVSVSTEHHCDGGYPIAWRGGQRAAAQRSRTWLHRSGRGEMLTFSASAHEHTT